MHHVTNFSVKSMSVDGPPQSLYHYTSVRGVEGILTSRSIWASLLHFMNDSREWLYALDLVRQHIQTKVHAREDRNWLAFIAEVSESLWRIRGLNVCVFSLSAAPNQLSQWRAYCPPDGGYQLHFERKLLEEHLKRHEFQLKPCIYEVLDQMAIVAAVVDPIISKVGELGDDTAVDTAVEKALEDLATQLVMAAPVLKHPDFQEEQEWRAFSLVSSTDTRMQYHFRGSLVIPHCLLQLETESHPFPVREVTVGPNANQLLAMRGLQAIKPGVAIVGKSETPLRNL